MDAPGGFEPPLTEPESAVLPLDDGANAGAPYERSGADLSMPSRAPSGLAQTPDAMISWRQVPGHAARDHDAYETVDTMLRDPEGRSVPASHPERRNAGRSHGRAVYSALDLGTNNCRLLIARPTRGGFHVIDAFSRIVRLGEGLAQRGRLSDDAMDRAIEALAICARKIRRRRVTCMRSVATEACRTATNRDHFLERVRSETGLNLDIISPAEEARLAVVGCQTLLDPSYSHALVFDIGGGSTELILVRRRGDARLEMLGWTSIPFGVVNVSERFDRKTLDAGDYEAIVSTVRRELDAFRERMRSVADLRRERHLLLGTSGTVTTLASVALALPHYDRSRVDGAWFAIDQVRELGRAVALMSYEERRAQPCIGPERADYVSAGCAILAAILDAWPCDRLRVADRGIREGILRGLMGTSQLVRKRRNRARGRT